ncbi:hypothetical protein CP02DC14_0979A, partial [Chlamydia psittaci 02DC14]
MLSKVTYSENLDQISRIDFRDQG